ncbi:MAG: hypothetical protein Q4F64_08340 [Corynebacterium casei]|nr:hypothetical protein [Corynebacterium casei]
MTQIEEVLFLRIIKTLSAPGKSGRALTIERPPEAGQQHKKWCQDGLVFFL